MQTDTAEFEDVEAVSETLEGLLCRVRDRRPEIAAYFLLEGTQVRKPGDHGRLVIPMWLARNLGLSTPPESGPTPPSRG